MRLILYIRLLTCLFILYSIGAGAQNADSTISKFVEYHRQNPAEKIYLHTDKEVYSYGETLWFSSYLLDASNHFFSDLSNIVYVELIDPKNKILSTLSIKISDGTGAGDFLLSDSLVSGLYEIRAYTSYMKNSDPDFYFSKAIKLISLYREQDEQLAEQITYDVDFQLFPEGGELLQGQVNHVAFRATDKKGIGVFIKGEIRDDRGNPVTAFETKNNGMGRFLITPQIGHAYRAVFTYYEKEFSVPFPKAQREGYLLNIRQNGEKAFVKVTSSPGMTFDNCYVIAHSRGTILTVVEAQAGKSFIYFALANDSIPEGISHFTFFKDGIPQLERLVFNQNRTLENSLFQSEVRELSKRENVKFDLEFEESGEFQTGQVSISVQRSSFHRNLTTIQNYVLLTSDLKGTIERPYSYFSMEESERRQGLDLLMMTHGWRRFRWEDVLTNEYPPILFYPEKGFIIEGQVVNYENRKKGRKATLLMTVLESLDQQEIETEEDGSFWFDGLMIEDTVTIAIHTINKDKTLKKSERKKKDNGRIYKDMWSFIAMKKKKSPETLNKNFDPFHKKENYRDYLDDVLNVKQVDAAFDGITVQLDEVVVIAKRKIERPFKRPSMLYSVPDSRLVMDSLNNMSQYTNIFQLIQGRIPGIIVQGSFPNQTITGRGGQVLVVIDGMPADFGLVSTLHPNSIEFIDVIKGARAAAIYGAYGVVAIYTRRGGIKQTDQEQIGFQTIRHFGFYPAREFYVPKYDIMSVEEKAHPDYRTTQYWNPKVEIDNGVGFFSFYTSDDSGDFTIYLEGMTNDGRILKDQLMYRVD